MPEGSFYRWFESSNDHMKSLLLHCKKFNSSITGLSTRGVEVAPETVSKEHYDHEDCIVAFITVEVTDDVQKITPRIAKEILKFATETSEKRVVIAPFAHLSSKLAPFKTGIAFFDILEKILTSRMG